MDSPALAHVALGILAAVTMGCGAGSAPPKAEPAVAAPTGPRCDPGEPDQPSDTKKQLGVFKQQISRCLLLGERPRGPVPMVFVLQVAEDGSVSEATVSQGSTGPSFEACANDAMHELRFEPFCGSDVELHWKVQVQ